MISQSYLRNKSLLIPILIHLVLGIIVYLIPSTTYYWQLLVIGFGSFQILKCQDRNEEAAMWAAYLSGMEVFYRMTGQSVFWELGKYGVVLFLLLGLAMKNRGVRYTYGLYFLLLVPSVFIAAYSDLMEARRMISFSLSGPLCLALSGLYFYKRSISGLTFLMLIRALILPVLAMVAYLFLTTPDFSTIAFDTESNFSASGDYGPNQVSLILGACVFFIIILRYHSISFSGYRWMDYILIGILLFRALVTFSRGGVFGAALALGVFVILNLISGYGKRLSNALSIIVVVVAGGLLVWNFTDSLTGKALTYRYTGINQKTGMEEEYTTGRLMAIERDFTIFQENMILGIGPGKSREQTEYTEGETIISHTEWTRLLAEHGMFGALALLIMIFIPLMHILNVHGASRGLLLAILILSFFSMFHAAMRLAIISYLYGWTLIIPIHEKNPFRRK